MLDIVVPMLYDVRQKGGFNMKLFRRAARRHEPKLLVETFGGYVPVAHRQGQIVLYLHGQGVSGLRAGPTFEVVFSRDEAVDLCRVLARYAGRSDAS